MSNELLPSPSNFFSEWGDFGRGGLNSAVLPSPLAFPTPNDGKGPSGLGLAVAREEGSGSSGGVNASGNTGNEKRKGSVEGLSEAAEAKRIKT